MTPNAFAAAELRAVATTAPNCDDSGSKKERPIIMHATSIRGILEGRKTQTRRIAKIPDYVQVTEAPQKRRGEPPKHSAPYFDAYNGGPFWCWWDEYDRAGDGVKCPYGVPGDRLWVKEAWAYRLDMDHLNGTQLYEAGIRNAWYWADGPGKCCNTGCDGAAGRIRSARFMPRWASRLTLEITNIRVERVQDISEEDAKAEGSFLGRCDCAVMQQKPRTAVEAMFKLEWCHIHGHEFKALWNDTNGKGAWERNDWVWVVEFRRTA